MTMIPHALRSQGKLVQTLSRMLGIVMLAVLIGQPIGAVPAFAQSSATLTGTVLDAASTPVAGVTVTLSGPATATTKTDADGHYTLTAPEGIYRILFRAPGYADSTDDAVTLTASGSTLDARIARPTLSSLQTIGSVRSSGGAAGGPTFNATAISQATISSATFDNQGDVGVRSILDETPGIVNSQSNGSANGGVRGSISFPDIRAGLSYETATLIDGHPLSVGKFGDYVTTFLNRYMFQTIEVDKGPGSMPNQITRSVNGTVNFRTWDPTPNFTGQVQLGLDNWGGTFTNFRASDTILKGKLGFVFDFATEGTPGAGGMSNQQTFIAGAPAGVTYTDSAGVPVSVSASTKTTAPGALTSTGITTQTIACCISLPTYYDNRSELAKLRYNFSDVTSFTASLLASQTYASQNGNTVSFDNVLFNPTIPSAFIPTGQVRSAFLSFSDFFAQDYEFSNEPIFSAELRTQLKNDNVLARFYSASIQRLQTNGDQSNSNFNVPVYLYGQTAGGAPLNGVDAYGKPYVAVISSPLFQTQEQDNLLGYTFEYDHFLGNSGNVVSFALDENYSWTHVYTPGSSDTSSASNIPAGSATDTGTFSLKGNFQIGPKLNLTAGYYLTRLDSHYPIFTGGAAPFTLNFGDNILWHGDERLALAYRLNHDTSLRFSLGSALVPPFLGVLAGTSSAATLCNSSNCPAGFSVGSVAVNNIGGLNIQPETSFGYDAGFDTRMKGWPDTVISFDAYYTNLWNQFLKSVFLNGTANIPGTGVLPLYTTAFGNLASSRYEGLEVKIDHSPQAGLGYAVQAALIRGFPYNVPASIYQFNPVGVATSNQGIVGGLNFGPVGLQGGSGLPYSQGYAELNYKTLSGWYGNVGVIYFGPGNTYNEPAFPITRATVRAPIHDKNTYLQASVDNIFNVNPEVIDVFGNGVQQPAINGNYEPTNLKGYGPTSAHFSLVHNFR